jgi:hypothetical protein
MSQPPARPPLSPQPRPSVRPTAPATLVVAALVSAGLGWLAVGRFYWDLPRLPWLPVITFAALAGLEAVAAQNTRARIDRRPGREPVDPLLVARFVVLAKASSMAGAIFGGLFAALGLWLLIERQRNAHAAADVPVAVGGVVASAALVAAALWLESACRVPHEPDESDKTPTDRVG